MGTLKLVVFDVDGTLIKVNSSWQFLHEKLGTWHKGKQHAKQFHQGTITYEEWAKLDASLWKGLPIKRIQRIIDHIHYTDGTQDAITTLKQNNLKTILLSTGVTLITERIKRETKVDDSIANELIIQNGFLTGDVKVNVSFHNKDKALYHMLQKFNTRLTECTAVGDDETLIPLFKKVGLGIAFNPTEKTIEKHAHVVIKNNDLRQVLPHLLKQRNSQIHHNNKQNLS